MKHAWVVGLFAGVAGFGVGCGGDSTKGAAGSGAAGTGVLQDGGAAGTGASQTDAAMDAAAMDATALGDSGVGAAPGHYFPSDAVWYQDYSATPADETSPAVIAALQSAGWGNSNTFQIDFSITVLDANASTPHRAFEPTGDFYDPDCDQTDVPVPVSGALEGEDGYACTQDGDCHLIVVDRDANTLYEMWRANIEGDTFYGGCLVAWDMTKVYPANGRGDQCTSADAAGYPIAPLLFTSEEVANGTLDHAIRFILPNDHIREGVFVHPATHSTGAASAGIDGVPYGAHLRLKSTPEVNAIIEALPSEGAKVVAHALQKHGMFLADGGQIALTAASDRFSTTKWEGLLGPRDLSSLQPQDFEMLEADAPIDLTYDCVRQ
jgi:hypothetical protein